jgi:hypothetical protein
MDAKASGFWADYRRFGTLAHPVTHGTLTIFLLLRNVSGAKTDPAYP